MIIDELVDLKVKISKGIATEDEINTFEIEKAISCIDRNFLEESINLNVKRRMESE